MMAGHISMLPAAAIASAAPSHRPTGRPATWVAERVGRIFGGSIWTWGAGSSEMLSGEIGAR